MLQKQPPANVAVSSFTPTEEEEEEEEVLAGSG